MTATGFAMSESAYSWQRQPEVWKLMEEGRTRSFGPWCIILLGRLSILRKRALASWTSEKSEATHAVIEIRLHHHGEPPVPFTRCWILAQVDDHSFFARKGSTQEIREDATAWLDALRALWRRYVPEEGRRDA